MAEPDANKNLDALMADALASCMPEVIRLRRHLHQFPELSGEEKKTAQLVAETCARLGLAVHQNIGGHGVLATLSIDDAMPWVALRADMDALPLQDTKTKDYHSGFAEIAHACGHDAHTAMLLGAASVLTSMKKHLQINVAFIFQPAEETCAGAAAMLADGLFAEFHPQAIYAFHVYPYLPSGSIGLREGVMCAAADMFDVEISGHGGHAARPHECTDVILVASHIIQSLHHIVSRLINPQYAAVLTIGQIHGGHASNVIPEKVTFSGTFRSLNPETHEQIRSKMDRIIRMTAETWGATAQFSLRRATPVLTNSNKQLAHARRVFEQQIPGVSLIDLAEPSMGGEDFAEFLNEVPGCLFRLGTGSGPETRYPLHHPSFDIDEDSMRTGVLALSLLALRND
ncbi:MAG TPA: amidohydrolase [Mariprofundaceae bacterium]|nr:amidohydrolase [Mariprofundaceae bacterium]